MRMICPCCFRFRISYFPPFLLCSRAATASFAIRLNSVADSLAAALAFPPLLAILAISAADRASALALPPKRPSACAFGFFFFTHAKRIIVLSGKQVKKKRNQ